MDGPLDVVTGAFSYTGRHIARRLLAAGRRVRTLTNHPRSPNPFGGTVKAAPLSFEDDAALARAMEGADTLYNTYWVRFVRGAESFDRAVRNSEVLFGAAEKAGVRRIVHVSIANPEAAPALPYFRGKAAVERALSGRSVSRAIVRPTVLFGDGDVFINNIAWLLRRFPVFPVAGDGRYRLQPVHVHDVAALAVAAGARLGDEVLDAAGPEVFAFEDLGRLIGARIGRRPRILHVPPAALVLLSNIIGFGVRDVVVNREELDGLMAGLLVSGEPARGAILFSEWLSDASPLLGREYASELRRHFR
ncbi:MAG: NAD(P)H-binding protein [Acidobacteria bacterium]|nr:NAD(P)H-binding protein [Acidobacteriota bacterium]